MVKLTSFFILPLFLLVTSVVFANEVQKTLMCKNMKTVRTLRIEKIAGGKCQTVYTKAGVDQIIGSGFNPNSCEKFLDDVKQTLIDAKWNCREFKESTVSTLGEVAN